MDRNETLTLLQLQRGAQIIGVRFTNTGRDGERYPSKEYHYKSVFLTKPGELVVVEAAEGFKVGSVSSVGINPLDSDIKLGELRHVVDVVDISRHASIKMEERHLMELVTKAELEDKLKAVMATPVFQALMAAPTPALQAAQVPYVVIQTPDGSRVRSDTGEVIE